MKSFNQRFDLKTGQINTMGILEYLAVEREKEGLEKGLQQGRELGHQEGLKEGRSETQRHLIENLLSSTEFSDEKIAGLVEVTAEDVKVIREELRQK